MPTAVQPEKRIVLVMARRDPALGAIERKLDELDATSWRVDSFQEFQQLTREIGTPEVIITGVSLPDGNWCDVLRSTVLDDVPTRVLVCTREADERLWSEAIWRGVYDILVEPLTVDHLERCIGPGNRPGGADSQDVDEGSRGREAERRPRTHRTSAAIAVGAVA